MYKYLSTVTTQDLYILFIDKYFPSTLLQKSFIKNYLSSIKSLNKPMNVFSKNTNK